MSLTEKDFSDTLSILTDFDQNAKILIAFSGGADSLALACLCSNSVGTDRLTALYVNHKIRTEEELSEEIELNKANCKKLGIKLEIVELDRQELEFFAQKCGTEAAARKLRYRALEEYAALNDFSYIATAHHFDDQIETLLMKAVSNAPIPAFRGIAEKKGKLIRPLLEFRKKEIEDYVLSQNFSWSFDSTNNDNSIKRNEIRNVIIPEIGTVMPDFEKRLLKLRSLALERENDTSPVSEFRLFEMWDRLFDTELPQTLIERVKTAFNSNKNEIISANGGTFCVYYSSLFLVDADKDKDYEEFTFSLKEEEREYELLENRKLVVSKTPNSDKDIHLDFSKLNKPILRYVKTGDVIHLKDGSKMVLRLLQDMKIAPVLRHRVPIIADGNEIIAVIGLAFGGKNRVCNKVISSLADSNIYVYIKNTDYLR